jgi:hypothetical protein
MEHQNALYGTSKNKMMFRPLNPTTGAAFGGKC